VMKRFFFLFILFIAIGGTAFSQQVIVAGSVMDQKTGEPLPGATVKFSGVKEFQLLSGLNGAFTRKVSAGSYKVEVFYSGYKTVETTVEVGEGKTPDLHFTMEPNRKELAEVRVTGKKDRGSEASSMLADRKADIVQNSLSARTIEISPDLSVANVSQRISG